MSAQIISASEGILTVKIAGQLTHSELVELQKQAATFLDSQEKTAILVVAKDFQGWAKQGAWGDVSFQVRYDARISRMAIVGHRKWEDVALVFAAKGVRSFPIEYFSTDELAKAHDWLKVAQALGNISARP